MKFDWMALSRLITLLSKIALDWFREINNDDEEARKARKAASRVLDPDTPENDVREVNL
jgi:hypothetical protein